jgi:hypothetical protein
MTFERLRSAVAAGFLLTLLAGDAPPATAQEPASLHARPELRVPHVRQPPELDGFLDDPAWAVAARLTGWVQTQPGDNVAPDGITEVRFVHDDEALYLAVRATDSRGIRYALHPRDVVTEQGQDWIGMLLDTYGDRRQAFGFALNPVGVQGDGMVLEGGTFVEWDGIFQSTGRVDPDGRGFTIEARIPFRSLRFPRRAVQRWGVGLSRTYGRTGAEDSPWPLDRDLGCSLCQLATLVLEGVEPGRNLELNPGLVVGGEASRPDPASSLDPYTGRLEPSLNVKYGIASNLTLDATLRPDFSQIESDAGQLEVNRRFALFFPEKRPFFLEGINFFQTGISPPGESGFAHPPVSLFHSRTVVEPDWGAKLSGKAGGIGLGAILARDTGPLVDLEDADGGAGVLVARSTVDVLGDGFVGAMVTGRRHAGATDVVAGLDTRLRLNDQLVVRGLYAASRYPSGESDLEGTPHFARSARALHAQADWQSRHWVGGVALVDVGRDFRAPLGFVPRTDQVLGTGSLAYIWRGTGLVHRIRPQLLYERVHEHGADGGLLRTGDLVDELWEPSLTVTLDRATTIGVAAHRAFTRHGGVAFPAQDRIGLSASSRALDWIHVSASALMGETVIFSDIADGDRAVPGWVRQAAATATLRPARPVRADLMLQTSRIWRRDDARPRASLYADALIPRLRVQYQASRQLGARGVVEWRRTDYHTPAGDAFDRQEGLSTEFLLSLVIDAGSAVYLGWTDLRTADLDWGLTTDRRGGVAKATYVWRF